MRLLLNICLLLLLLIMLVTPTFAQDGVLSDGDVLLSTGSIFGLLIMALLGGGVGYIARAIREVRDERFMTILENQYNQSNSALQQTVQTLESATRFLAVSIPMNDDFRQQFLAVADVFDEVSDEVPVAAKSVGADSPSDPGGEVISHKPSQKVIPVINAPKI